MGVLAAAAADLLTKAHALRAHALGDSHADASVVVYAAAMFVLAVAVHLLVFRGSSSSINSEAGFTWQELPPTNTSTTSSSTNEEDGATGHAKLVATRLPVSEQRSRASAFHKLMSSRRSMRFFSPDPVDDEVLAKAIATAGTAPSGAHKQPWVFCVVRDQETKDRIRELVEAEELVNYERRMKKASLTVAPH